MIVRRQLIATAAALLGILPSGVAAHSDLSASDLLPSSFCATTDRGLPKSTPEDVTAIIDDETNQYDGFQTAEAVLTSAAIDVAHASKSEEACLAVFTAGSDQFASLLSDKRSALAEKGGGRLSKSNDIAAVQQEITRLWREDQAGRFTYLASRTEDKIGADFWAARLAVAHSKKVDEESKRYIEGLLDRYDWIDRKRFGNAVSAHAWILVQHADNHPEFQARVLARMEPYLKTKGVYKKNYAYLWDRVAVNTGREQRYGTQPDWTCKNGKMALKPLEDPENVDRRRKKMGLNKVEKGLAQMSREICGPAS